jgi:23S rRNA (adenine2503-C2)-methyltransferase
MTLTGFTLQELTETFEPRFRAVQIFKWIARGCLDYNQMTDIPLSLKEELQKKYTLNSCKLIRQKDSSHAVKITLELRDGLKIESVLLIDGKGRATACLSTQAGCPAGCVFCKTGNSGFNRNLDSGEMVEQLIFLSQIYSAGIGNIVIMGMGEPLLNLEQLRKAITIITDAQGMGFSRRKIILSTCGIYEGLFDIARNGPNVRIALSLTTGDEELRQKLMPITRTQPLAKVKEALTLIQKNGRLTLEAALLGGINTRYEDAISIAEFAKGLNAVINLIPWNPVSGLEFEGKPLREPDKKEVGNYISMLENLGLKVTMRLRKGRKVMGACGQLS